MTYSLAHSWSNSGQNVHSLAVSPTANGDVLVFAYDDTTGTGVSSAISGGGVTTWHTVEQVIGPSSVGTLELYWGVVTSTGSSTISLTNGNSSTDFDRVWAGQFNDSGAGTWSQVTHANGTGSGTAFNYPSLSGTGLYVGAANEDFGAFTAGSTTGCTYVVVDNHLLMVYDLAASNDNPNGTTTDSGANIITAAVLLSTSGAAATATPQPYVAPNLAAMQASIW